MKGEIHQAESPSTTIPSTSYELLAAMALEKLKYGEERSVDSGHICQFNS